MRTSPWFSEVRLERRETAIRLRVRRRLWGRLSEGVVWLLFHTFEPLFCIQIHLLRLRSFLDDFLNDKTIVCACITGCYFKMVAAPDDVDLHFTI